MQPIIEIKSISKKFRIRHEQQPYLSLRDTFSDFFKGTKKESSEDFWALKDVSFDVHPGDTIGIIGKNGAGKSTLLKILSKITPPTAGRIISRGRIASLLEVGTGFHPELSGKENIFLNGSILGMRRKEIQFKFDEIVDFSGIDRFIDTPLKHFSSGMQLRLAFAVAAFLEPEILVIDEVLAVGDAEFQRKCIGKMESVGKSGRTILFVSHNLSQVQGLCNKGILLEKGRVTATGNMNKVISDYVSLGKNNSMVDLAAHPRTGAKNNDFTLEKLIVNNGNDIYERENVELELSFTTRASFNELVIGFAITDSLNIPLIECRSTSSIKNLTITSPGQYTVKACFSPNLKSGSYTLNVGARYANGFLEHIPSATYFEILPSKNSIEEEEWKRASSGLLITDSTWIQKTSL